MYAVYCFSILAQHLWLKRSSKVHDALYQQVHSSAISVQTSHLYVAHYRWAYTEVSHFLIRLPFILLDIQWPTSKIYQNHVMIFKLDANLIF